MPFGQSVLALRRLLARIRDVMASDGDGGTRLDRIAHIVAADMSAQVCSIYVRRAGDVLELFATEGLRKTAVHRTRLRIGEGLIGEIAATGRPLSLADAWSHPSFVYRPETGEESFRSLMGVPIQRGGRVVGVLAIQSSECRQHTEEEIEALQTIAMVLAELVANGDLIGSDELAPTEGTAMTPRRLEGIRLTPGQGIGVAVLHKHRQTIHRWVAEDPQHELERLHAALADMHGTLDDMLRADGLADGEPRDILQTYRMIAEDVGWLRRISDAIITGLTAEAAVQKVQDEIHTRIAKISDAYLKERVHDLEDLAQRLLQHLLGVEETAANIPHDREFVLVARRLGPAQLLDYSRSRLTAVVLEEGSANAHVTIVARALGIPLIGQVSEAMSRIDAGDLLIVDADHAQVLIRPAEDIKLIFQRSIADRRRRQEQYLQLRDVPAVTRDGVHIALTINAGLLLDVQHFGDLGVEGIGLYRTELPFLVRSELPDVDSQRQLYQRVLNYASGKPVVFRTLDIGGDKILPYWQRVGGDNPALGWRAIRVSCDRPALLRQQLRALVQAAAEHELFVMFPMVAEVREYRLAKHLLEMELDRHARAGRPPPTRVHTGCMLEVPALLYQLDDLLRVTDFLAIGTNDLMQFLFASDRSSHWVSARYDSASPVMFNVLRSVIERCDAAGVALSLCGEMAGQPLEAMALVGLGLRRLSVSPPCVGPIKMMIRSVTLSSLSDFVARLCRCEQRSVREDLLSFARDHGIVVG